ncbi:sensor histidine kinase [Halobaculum sp. EA56]|uniref:sensor histidine kinase n=1 Tax=Halobaculum sp. EA56 TaxID=3421648 RepID=UPI003EBF2804
MDPRDRGVATRVVVVATLLAFLGLYLYNFVRLEQTGDIDALREYIFVLLLAMPVVVLTGCVLWMHNSDIDQALLVRLLPWMGGSTMLSVVGIWLTAYAVGASFDRGEQLLLVNVASGFGVSAGTIVGIMELKAICRARAQTRSELRAVRVERERERLLFFNSLLRHEVLNSANVIHGYARLLREEAPSDDQMADRLATIRDRSADISAFVSSVREILSESERPTLEPVAVRDVLLAEADRVEDSFSVSIDVRVPAGTVVLADGLVKTVFSNLLENAAVHAGERPSVVVSATTDAETTVVEVADDGEGIDEEVSGELFEPSPSSDHGNGLYHVRNIVESYGGRIRVSSSDEGATFAVEFRTPPEREQIADEATTGQQPASSAGADADEQRGGDGDPDWFTAI